MTLTCMESCFSTLRALIDERYSDFCKEIYVSSFVKRNSLPHNVFPYNQLLLTEQWLIPDRP